MRFLLPEIFSLLYQPSYERTPTMGKQKEKNAKSCPKSPKVLPLPKLLSCQIRTGQHVCGNEKCNRKSKRNSLSRPERQKKLPSFPSPPCLRGLLVREKFYSHRIQICSSHLLLSKRRKDIRALYASKSVQRSECD